MRYAKNLLAIIVCIGIGLYPWNILNQHIMTVKMMCWICGAVIAVVLTAIFSRSKYGYIAYIVIFGSLLMYGFLGLRVEGWSTTLSYAGGVFASMDLYSLIFGPPKKSRRAHAKNNMTSRNFSKGQTQPMSAVDKGPSGEGGWQKNDTIQLRGQKILGNASLEDISRNIVLYIDDKDRANPHGVLKLKITREDPACEFDLSEFDDDFLDEGKIVEDNGRVPNTSFALIFKKEYYLGSEVDETIGEFAEGRFVIYSPEGYSRMGIVFDEESTRRFTKYIDDLLIQT